jgi:stage IV sporulation protein FB
MFLGDPPPSPADLLFRLFGFPVRVHPFFWLVTLFLALGGGGPAEPVSVLIWVAVVFVSVLVHELGHAFMQRYFGGHPWITLHSFGGLAACNDCDRSPRSHIIILLAGPGAGFVLAAVLLLGLWIGGHDIFLVERIDSESIERWLQQYKYGIGFFEIGWKTFAFEGFASILATRVVQDLLYVNVLWGLVNLLPVYPLDGGQIARELFTLGNPRQGIIRSLQLSIVTAIAMAAYALSRSLTFTCIMFALLAYGSYQALRAYQDSWR